MVRSTARCAPATERAVPFIASDQSEAQNMTRLLFSFCVVSSLLALLPAAAGAEEIPIRKAGLWEMKMVRTNSQLPEMTMQQCTDEATDKEMSTAFSPMSKEICSKKDIQKTATGYVSDSVCGLAGVSITSHSEIIGDFDSAYTVKSTSHTERGPTAVQGDHVTTIEAKWLGACKPDQKPGDVMMPGGMKMNIHDADKLKSLLPKQMQKQ
jgi:Protein of unknown function (DUF3617)